VLKRLFSTRNIIILVAVVALFVVHNMLGLKVPKPDVSVAAEPIFSIGPFAVTNSLLTAWIAMVILILMALAVRRNIPRNLEEASNEELLPTSGLQNAMEMVLDYIHKLVEGMSGIWTDRFFPIATTIFLFVIVSNWLGLIPGVGSIGILVPVRSPEAIGLIAQGAVLSANEAPPGTGFLLIPFLRSPSADLNFTIALALISVALTQYYGFRATGTRYLSHFFDTSGFKNGALVGVAQFFAGILELVGEFTKIISFSFRLFGNIFAGEVLLLVLAYLIPYIASLPFYGLELFVGFIQAAVFMMLTLVFFNNATFIHHSGAEQHAG
jgi:F-type H+-transporting ATPase subunit a